MSEGIDLVVDDFEDNPAKEHTFFLPKKLAGKRVGVHPCGKDGTVKVVCDHAQLGSVGRVLQTFGAKMTPFDPMHPGFEAPAKAAEKPAKADEKPANDKDAKDK